MPGALEEQHTPVLIIGGGPVGLTTALLLARYGLGSTIVERYPRRLGQPKAHALNPRSLEILRQAGLDTVQLRRAAASPVDADRVRFGLSPQGLELGTLPFERQGRDTLALSPEPLFNIPQPELEDWLMAAIAENPLITLKRGVEWEHISDSPGDSSSSPVGNSEPDSSTGSTVLSQVLERDTQRRTLIRSKYLLACDGARSRAREKLSIPFCGIPNGPSSESHHVTIHFRADLRHLAPGIIWYVFGATQQGAFLAYDRGSSWVYVTNWDPKRTSRETFTAEYCGQMMREAMGAEFTFDIQSITIWTTHPRIADCYRSGTQRRGFVVGDAAHAFPPTGGLGVNTGIADAQNLAWKVDAVERGWAGDALLDTYGLERRPVAMANARQSAKNQKTVYRFFAARPPGVSDEQLERDIPWRERFAADIADDAEHFDSINLQLGYVYGGEAWDRGPCNVFTPSAVVGVRMPHAWVSGSRSALDLVDGMGFVVLGAADCFPGEGDTLVDGQTEVPVRVLRLGKDFVCEDDAWVDMMGLSRPGQGVLIRPDQHILGFVASREDVAAVLGRCLLQDGM